MKMSVIALLLAGSQAFALESKVVTGVGMACNRELPEAYDAAIGQALSKAMIECGATRKVNVLSLVREEARSCVARVVLRFSCETK